MIRFIHALPGRNVRLASIFDSLRLAGAIAMLRKARSKPLRYRSLEQYLSKRRLARKRR